jgi:pyruvate/oxaloacetate carboxyltransferase
LTHDNAGGAHFNNVIRFVEEKIWRQKKFLRKEVFAEEFLRKKFVAEEVWRALEQFK